MDTRDDRLIKLHIICIKTLQSLRVCMFTCMRMFVNCALIVLRILHYQYED